MNADEMMQELQVLNYKNADGNPVGILDHSEMFGEAPGSACTIYVDSYHQGERKRLRGDDGNIREFNLIDAYQFIRGMGWTDSVRIALAEC